MIFCRDLKIINNFYLGFILANNCFDIINTGMITFAHHTAVITKVTEFNLYLGYNTILILIQHRDHAVIE